MVISNLMASLASGCMWTTARNKTESRYTGVMHTKFGAGPFAGCDVMMAPNFAHHHHFLGSTHDLKSELKPAA